MNNLLDKLRVHVTTKAGNPSFVHHKWFVKWHLEIVETLSRDMLAYYPEADEATIVALAWMHDYGKILDFDSQYSHSHIEAGRVAMIQLGFDETFATKIAESIKILDAKDNLQDADIEVRIVSSADGCSHLVGPFFSLYWHEHPDVPFEKLMTDNQEKLAIDWNKKVTIPEAIAAYQPLHDRAMSIAKGEIKPI